MSVGDALSKTTTYGDIIDIVRLRTSTVDRMDISDNLLLKLTSISVQKVAKLLNGVNAPFYTTTNSVLTISGTANPYTVDLSSVAPFIERLIRVVHITTGGTRTLVKMLPPGEGERITGLSTVNASSIYGVHEGDVIRLYKGSSFTITIATDTVEIKYFRQPKVGSTSSAAVVSDVAWSAAGTTISAFTGMTTALVGGTFVGLDGAAAAFARTITQYVSATSFLITSALANEGAGTNGYIIPPNSNTYTVTTGTYVDIPDSFVSMLVDEVATKVLPFKNNGMSDQGLETALQNERQAAIQAYGMGEQTVKE